MKKRILKLLVCPNAQEHNLSAYGSLVKRKQQILRNLYEDEIREDDDIIFGLLINKNENYAYPIMNFVPILLADGDIDPSFIIRLFRCLRNLVPAEIKGLIDLNINRISELKVKSETLWNTEEMRYFDKLVQTRILREKFLSDIKKKPLWDLYISRERNLFKNIERRHIHDRYVLEVGCGNSRTVRWVFNPERYKYNYIGCDISLKRLFHAKMLMTESDFIQCNAYNLPFRNESFAAIIGLGIFHHLPFPDKGIKNSVEKLASRGYLIIHEPVIRPNIINLPSAIKKFLSGYEQSAHDGEIDSVNTIALLKDMGLIIRKKVYERSIFRHLCILTMQKFHLTRFKWLTELNILIDGIFVNSIGKISKYFGPSSLFLIAQKP